MSALSSMLPAQSLVQVNLYCCRQILLGLAEWLCQYRTTDTRAAQIVNDMHLFLVPTVNPDGFQQRQRENL